MRSQNRKVKSYVPVGGGVLLLLLVVCLICPVVPNGVWAEGVMGEEQTRETTSDALMNGVSTDADTGVTITFSPTTGSASLTPTTADGSLAKIDVTANIKIASTGGYTIYVSGENAALTGAKTGATIPGAVTATTLKEMKANTWGYAYAEGSNVPDGVTYSALPQGQGKVLKSVSGNNTDINHTYALSFATRIGNDKPADIYSNQVTLSVTSSPLEVTTYRVNYDANGGTGSADPAIQTVTSADPTYGFTAAAQGTLAKSGNEFLGWAESATATSETYIAGTSEVLLTKVNPTKTLYAVWKAVAMTNYSITYAHDDRSKGTLPAKQEAESSADSYTFIAPEKPSDLYDGVCSHPFVGWSTTKQGYTYTADYTAGSSITLMKDNPNITLYPVWRPANYC